MKKTYISPAMVMVQLSTTTHMMQMSVPIDKTGSRKITNQEDILVKETTPNDVNVWDNEW